MKKNYSGNIKRLSSLIDRINSQQKLRFFPTNEITGAKLDNKKFELIGMLFEAIGQIEEQKNNLYINLKVRLKRQFTFAGLFVILLLSGFIWGGNVTINGDYNPSIWIRIEFLLIFLLLLSIPTLILLKLRNDFKKKVKNLLK